MFGHSHGHGHGGHSHSHFFSMKEDEGERQHVHRGASLRRLIKLARPEMGYILASTLLLAISAGVNLLVPWSMGVIIDSTNSVRAHPPRSLVTPTSHVNLFIY
jgi:hypothetical protein